MVLVLRPPVTKMTILLGGGRVGVGEGLDVGAGGGGAGGEGARGLEEGDEVLEGMADAGEGDGD